MVSTCFLLTTRPLKVTAPPFANVFRRNGIRNQMTFSVPVRSFNIRVVTCSFLLPETCTLPKIIPVTVWTFPSSSSPMGTASSYTS